MRFIWSTLKKPLFKPDIDYFWKWSIPLFIILSVLLSNTPYLFTDTLWHDDGIWYYRASEGQFIQEWRGKVTTLSPYLDCFYLYAMVSWGLPFTRGIFTLVMALSSLLLFFLYNKVFGVDLKLAIPAAVIPNILPSLMGIPVGLNASYAMWGLLPVTASLLLLNYAFTHRESVMRILLMCISFVFYMIGLNLPGQPSTNFLIPVVLFFCIMHYPSNKARSIRYIIPFLGYGVWQIYKQVKFGHRSPSIIPVAEVIDRLWKFVEMSSFLPFNKPYSPYITIGLVLFGVLGLLCMDTTLYRQPSNFNYKHNIYRLLFICWPLCWIISNSLAYVTASEEFRAPDYAYMFNFGMVLLQTSGLIFLFEIVVKGLGVSFKTGQLIIALLSIGVIVFVGFQRIQYKNHSWGWKPYLERTSQILRDNLANYSFPNGSQILVLGEGIGVSYNAGVLYNNSGYIRYLLGQNDLHALVGPDKFPRNIFAPWAGHFKHMRGFNIEKPVVAFKKKGDILERVNLMMQVVSSERKELPRLIWTIYDINDINKPPYKLADGKGMTSYSNFIQNEIHIDPSGSGIAFSPQGKPDDFIDDLLADQIAKAPGLLNGEVNFGDKVILRNVSTVAVENGYQLQLLLRVIDEPKRIKLGYRLHKKGWGQEIALWDFVMNGDNLLLQLPRVTDKELNEGITFEFLNKISWPPKPLSVQDNKNHQIQFITLKK